MAATITAVNTNVNPDVTNREVIVYFTVPLTGNYGGGATHGDVLNLTQLQDLLKSSQLPLQVELWEAPPAGTAPSGYGYVFAPGTTQANGQLVVLAGPAALSGPASEYPEGTAYNAALLAAVIKGCAWFPSY